jgi:hypothetical protein
MAIGDESMSRIFALAVTAVLPLLAMARAQTPEAYAPPRLADGRPDLQGTWATAFLTGMERPDDVKELVVPQDQVRALAARFLSYTPDVVDPDANFGTDFTLAVVKGGYRSSLVVDPPDGKMPYSPKALTAVARAQALGDFAFDNPEERPTIERCIIGWGQAPLRPEHGFVPTQIVQTRNAIVLMTEDVGGLRIIHMDGAPPPEAVRSYEGYSKGRWEGDTLVIETTHLRADDPYRDVVGRTVVVGPKSKVVERLTRLSETELLEQFTVEDPELYTRPWLAEFSLTRSAQPAYEYACHEANYALTNMLRAGRQDRQDKPTLKPSH